MANELIQINVRKAVVRVLLILLLLVMPETRDRGVSHSVDRRKAQEPPPVA